MSYYVFLSVITIVVGLVVYWLYKEYSYTRVDGHGTGVSTARRDPANHLDEIPVSRPTIATRDPWGKNGHHAHTRLGSDGKDASLKPATGAVGWQDRARLDGDYGYLGDSANGSKSKTRFLGGDGNLDWLGTQQSK